MQIRMQMRLVQRLGLETELTDPDKIKLQAAYDLWEGKTKLDFSVPVDTLQTIFGATTQNTSTQPSGQKESILGTEWREQFVMVTPAEMATIDDDEKFAVLLGNCIYVSTETPTDYIPIGVLNLAAARRAKDDSAFAQVLKAKGLSGDYARHYTASLTDVLAAQHLFRNKPSELAAFLRWRKSIERTDFFNDDTIGEILARKLQTRARARHQHPTERGRYTKRSFVLAAALESTMTRGQVDAIVQSFGVTKADIIVGRIKDEPSFDSTAMLEIIDIVVGKIREISAEKNLPKHKRTISLTSRQSVQAYLLTADICGVSNILVPTANPSTYLANHRAIASLIALKDRLLHLSKQALARIVPESNDMALLRALVVGTQQLVPLPQLEKIVPADETTGNAALAKIETQRDELNRSMSEAEALLAQYAQIERAFADLGAKEAVPGVLAQDRKKIQDHLEAIKAQFDVLQRYEGALASLVEVRAKFGSLFAQLDRLAD